MKKLSIIIMSIMFFLAVSLYLGCAASKPQQAGTSTAKEEKKSKNQDDYAQIEKLLGIDKETTQRDSASQSKTKENNDDLLNLLKADEGKGKSKKAQSGVGDIRLTRLQKENANLKKQLRDKQILIADLKAQLTMKEQALKERGGTSSFATLSGNISESEYEDRYNQALDLFNSQQYRQALDRFQELVGADTRNSLADNAQYWIGECYYALGDYQAAIVAFEKVFTFKQSNKNDYAQYKLGLCYYKLNNRSRARAEFQALVDNYPDSELVQRARQYLAQL